jgi:hypothetical protein
MHVFSCYKNVLDFKGLMLVTCFVSLSENTVAPSPAVCYYILLPCQHSPTQQVMICLLATTETNLEVFRPELTQFCEMLVPHIPSDKVVKHACVIRLFVPISSRNSHCQHISYLSILSWQLHYVVSVFFTFLYIHFST